MLAQTCVQLASMLQQGKLANKHTFIIVKNSFIIYTTIALSFSLSTIYLYILAAIALSLFMQVASGQSKSEKAQTQRRRFVIKHPKLKIFPFVFQERPNTFKLSSHSP